MSVSLHTSVRVYILLLKNKMGRVVGGDVRFLMCVYFFNLYIFLITWFCFM